MLVLSVYYNTGFYPALIKWKMKEESPVNLFTQAVLYWTLLGLLLVWMVICAVLALRPESKQQTTIMHEDAPLSSNTYAFAPASTLVQINTSQHVPVLLHAGNVNRDTSSDINTLSTM
jgi:hypothetical protein